jgi:3-oxoacyl-[acyl-carrier-protein] synthase II
MRRVVISGIGVVTSIGVGRQAFWDNLVRGASGVGPVTSFDTSALPVHIGGEVRDFEPQRFICAQNPGDLGRAAQFAVAAARLALEDSALDIRSAEARRVGVSVGTTSGEPSVVERYNDFRYAGRLDRMPPEILPRYPCHMIPAHIAREWHLGGPSLMIPTACAAGNYALGYAADLIRAGRVDVMLAGGADAFSRITYTGFARLGVIAPDRCQPFDLNRKGMVPGEGSAMMVLEDHDSAERRGATIYAELAGYGISCDAHHMTAGDPQADGAVRAMSMALKESGFGTQDVDYISAHGTGTTTNDRLEALAKQAPQGERAARIPMSSIKSMLGHTMGAASAIEAAACALAIHCHLLPPTINYEQADPDCEVDCVPNKARSASPRVVLNNAYAFGGNNASLCLARWGL